MGTYEHLRPPTSHNMAGMRGGLDECPRDTRVSVYSVGIVTQSK